MNSNRFNELLERYLADVATVEERNELMAMIHAGSHDESVDRRIQSMLSGGRADENMDPQRAREILKGIVACGGKSTRPVKRGEAVSWRWYAAAAIALVLISTGWWLNRPEPARVSAITTVIPEAERAVFIGKQFVHLPDGSKVLLNQGSRLSYAPTFGEQDREVVLAGEGYFDVRHDAGKPFRVVTGSITTVVLGTSFNVKAYPDQQEVKVTVTRGKVQVNNETRLLGVITPDQQISVNTLTNDFVQRNVKAETATSWQSQYLILDDVSLEEAVKTIAAKYDVQIAISNVKLRTCRISATFLKGETLGQVLTVVSGVLQATYTIDASGNVTIDGKGCV
jgi:transmembrane sensor